MANSIAHVLFLQRTVRKQCCQARKHPYEATEETATLERVTDKTL